MPVLAPIRSHYLLLYISVSVMILADNICFQKVSSLACFCLEITGTGMTFPGCCLPAKKKNHSSDQSKTVFTGPDTKFSGSKSVVCTVISL